MCKSLFGPNRPGPEFHPQYWEVEAPAETKMRQRHVSAGASTSRLDLHSGSKVFMQSFRAAVVKTLPQNESHVDENPV